MIELRWYKIKHPSLHDSAVKFHRPGSDDPGFWVILQYRKTEPYFYEPIIDKNGIKTLNPIEAEWRDVGIIEDE